MVESKEVKEEAKEETKYSLVEISTQSGIAIETPEGKTIGVERALVDILNYLKDIKKLLG